MPLSVCTTPLGQRSSMEVALELLRAGAKADAQMAYGVTPLLLAALSHEPEIVRVFIQHGANPNSCITNIPPAMRMERRASALHIAAYLGDVETVRLLLAAAANPDVKNGAGQTPLDVVRFPIRSPALGYGLIGSDAPPPGEKEWVEIETLLRNARATPRPATNP